MDCTSESESESMCFSVCFSRCFSIFFSLCFSRRFSICFSVCFSRGIFELFEMHFRDARDAVRDAFRDAFSFDMFFEMFFVVFNELSFPSPFLFFPFRLHDPRLKTSKADGSGASSSPVTGVEHVRLSGASVIPFLDTRDCKRTEALSHCHTGSMNE